MHFLDRIKLVEVTPGEHPDIDSVPLLVAYDKDNNVVESILGLRPNSEYIEFLVRNLDVN